jgi:hypothetical protein
MRESFMDTDFPAAHSMDTQWFAVDRDGHVAAFWTGLEGPLPTGSGNDEIDWRAFSHGLFYYEHNKDEEEPFLEAYLREHRPRNPLHIDQLPPELRRVCKQVCFDSLRFAEMEYLQPMDFLPCDTASGVGYRSSDGKVIRPVPDREEQYRDYYRQHRGQLERDLEGVRFEGLEEPAEPDKPKRRRGKPGRKPSDGA